METNNKRTLASSTAIMNLLVQAGQKNGVKIKDEEFIPTYLVRPIRVEVKDVETDEFPNSKQFRNERDFAKLTLKRQIDSAIRANDLALVEKLEAELAKRFPTTMHVVFKFETPQRIFCSMEREFYSGVVEFQIEESYLESELIEITEIEGDLIQIKLLKGAIDLSTKYDFGNKETRYAHYSYLTMAEESKIRRIISKSKPKESINFISE